MKQTILGLLLLITLGCGPPPHRDDCEAINITGSQIEIRGNGVKAVINANTIVKFNYQDDIQRVWIDLTSGDYVAYRGASCYQLYKALKALHE